jgi:predicted DNA-binding transcriptional regulator
LGCHYLLSMTSHADTAAESPQDRGRLPRKGDPDTSASEPATPKDLPGGREIGIVLSPSQIEHVVGAALESGPPNIPALLTALHTRQDVSRVSLEKRYRSELSEARLSHSLLRGLLVLSMLIDGSKLGVSDIARRLDMSSSTAYRYVSTLLAFGLVEQDQVTRRYRLAAGLPAEPPQKPMHSSRAY